MAKIANFIVEKRKFILIVFAALTLCSVWFATKVSVNYDMTKYMPEDSSTKAGLEVMDAEFPAANSVYVMFKGLSENEKSQIHNGLSEIKDVQSVSYEAGNEKYNKEDYTLYSVSMSYGAYSAEAKAAVAAINEQYSAYDITLSGEAAGMQDLGFIFIPAVAILLVILFLMSKSWFEPLILIGNIGIAILLNMGTNAIFDSVSEITQAIAAILQLVLSMDYSIMLINRYRQEKELTDNKYDAMKKALHGAFVAISSSSVTTIVGMFMLVFMSFTIGMDLGLVIAKGVFFSLLCVFTVMPALVVIFDKVIEKTSKPTLRFKMNKLASFSYAARYVMLAVFIGLFAVGFSIRNNVNIDYTINAYDDVYQTFAINNPIVVIYENKDEEKISVLAEKWESNEFVDSVNAYATTLGKEMSGAQFTDSMDMDESMIDLLFYAYFNGKSIPENKSLALGDFLRFVSDDVASSEAFAGYIPEELSDQLDKLSMFTDPEKLTAAMTSAETSAFFGIEEETVRQLFLYYYSVYGGADYGSMTLGTFAAFIQNDVAANAQYSQYFDETALTQIGTLAAFTDKDTINMPLDSGTLSQMTGMDAMIIEQIFYLRSGGTGTVQAMSVYDFIGFVVTDLVSNANFAAVFDPSALQHLGFLKAVMDAAQTDKEFTGAEMAELMGMDVSTVSQLYLYYTSLYGNTDSWKIPLNTLVDFIAGDISGNEAFSNFLDVDMLDQLNAAQAMINGVLDGKSYTAAEMSGLLDLNSDMINGDAIDLLYLLYFSKQDENPDWKLPAYKFMEFIVNDVANDERFSVFFSEETIKELSDYMVEMDDGLKQLVGGGYSRIIINTSLSEESDETFDFVANLESDLSGALDGEYYLIGNSAMAYEMAGDFSSELNFITILTAISIFLVVMIAFRSLSIPLILVCLIQCAVYITMGTAYIQGSSIYYLALLIVQCLMMGATIDYGLLYTSNYVEARASSSGIKESMITALNNTIHTVMTSGLILVTVTLALGILFAGQNYAVSEILLIIARGCFIAIILVMLILPSVLAIFDKFVIKKRQSKNND